MPQNTLTFTLRLHNPAEKKDAAKSTAWSVIEVPREDFKLPKADFLAKYVEPGLAQMLQQLALL
jgi:hypothetical protein